MPISLAAKPQICTPDFFRSSAVQTMISCVRTACRRRRRSLPPPLLLSGLQNCRRLGRRNQNRDRCPLWINRLALPDSRAVAAASRFTHSSAEARIQPPTWMLQRHPTLVTNSPNKRTSRPPSTGEVHAGAGHRHNHAIPNLCLPAPPIGMIAVHPARVCTLPRSAFAGPDGGWESRTWKEFPSG